MKIKYRLAFNFSLLVVVIILIFSFCIYVFAKEQRQKDFVIRLQNKAINAITVLNTDPFALNKKLLKIIDRSLVTNMDQLTVVVLDSLKNILYTNENSQKLSISIVVFKKLDWNKNNSLLFNRKIYTCIPYYYQNKKYYLLASAGDLYGAQELQKLLIIILFALIFSIFLAIIAGFFYAALSLKPIKEISHQIDEIEATNLKIKLKTKNNDEIAELAHTINKMMKRIYQAFEYEKFFVSNVSHELRTPVTSIKGQVEVALMKERNTDEYKNLLNSILDDIKNMTNIINGFLELAETNTDQKDICFQTIQIDELLFAVKDEFIKRKPEYIVNIEFVKIPDDESKIAISGNQELLLIMIRNLVDNACKFSANKTANIQIDFNKTHTIILISDTGMGIAEKDKEYIFQPLYRARNAHDKTGNGIGLSIVHRIAQIHKAKINISSILNQGTNISIVFPKL